MFPIWLVQFMLYAGNGCKHILPIVINQIIIIKRWTRLFTPLVRNGEQPCLCVYLKRLHEDFIK